MRAWSCMHLCNKHAPVYIHAMGGCTFLGGCTSGPSVSLLARFSPPAPCGGSEPMAGAAGAALPPSLCGKGAASPKSTTPPSCVLTEGSSVAIAMGSGGVGGGSRCASSHGLYLSSLGLSSTPTSPLSLDSKRDLASSVRSMALTTNGVLYLSPCCVQKAEVGGEMAGREGG